MDEDQIIETDIQLIYITFIHITTHILSKRDFFGLCPYGLLVVVKHQC